MLDERAREILEAVPDDRDGCLLDWGIARADAVGSTMQEALQYPSLNVRGMQAGHIGSEAAAIIPDVAIAEIDVRTVPETEPTRLFGLLVEHIRTQGYLVLARPPTDDERATHAKIASWVEHRRSGTFAARTPVGASIGRWIESALRASSGVEPVQIRMMGGTIPTDALVRRLAIPFAIIPLANYDDNQHAPNENLRLANMEDGVRSLIALLTFE